MKAARIDTYDGPRALKYGEAPRPRPEPGGVLVRVRAAGHQVVALLLTMMPEFELAVVLGTGLVAGAAWERWGIWLTTVFVTLGTGLVALLEAAAMWSRRVLALASGAERPGREALRNPLYGPGPLEPSPRLDWSQIRENVLLHLVIIALTSGFTRIVLVMLAWSGAL